MSSLTILMGDWIEKLKTLSDKSVQTCVTSPPYWSLRDYGVAGQLGLEKTPEEYVAKLVTGFREIRRVLADDGTLWLNLGDSYWSNQYTESRKESNSTASDHDGAYSRRIKRNTGISHKRQSDLNPKNLVGMPWRVAFALQADGWHLRCDIIWAKPNPMPESVNDRPTRAHEYIFLLSKKAKYFYDAEAIKEPAKPDNNRPRPFGDAGGNRRDEQKLYNPQRIGKEGRNSRMHVSRDPQHESEYNGKHRATDEQAAGRRLLGNVAAARAAGANHDSPLGLDRNKRSVWTVTTSPYKNAHFATFPPDLIKPCILAGSRPGDTVLDPFCGSGTTGQVSLEYGRKFIGIELNPEYVALAEQRCNVTPGFKL